MIQEKYTARYVDRGSDGIPAKSSRCKNLNREAIPTPVA